MKILVSGATGLIGSSLIPYLKAQGHTVVRLVRTPRGSHATEIVWDPMKGIIDPSSLEGFDAVIHLSGENIASGRWNKKKKKAIFESRVGSTRLLCHTLSCLTNPPKVFIGASAVGIYGNRGDEVLTEKSSPGEGFLAGVCRKWEEASRPALESGIRVVSLRCGMVLSSEGGALEKMITPFKLCLGGILGSGRQYVSWIAVDDLVRMIGFILNTESIRGPVNAVSIEPVTNREWTETLGRLLHRPTFMRMPAFLVRLLFGEPGNEVLLASERAVPKKITDAGFDFMYPTPESALRTYLNKL